MMCVDVDSSCESVKIRGYVTYSHKKLTWNTIYFSQKCPYFDKEGRWENKITNVPN